MSEKVKRVIRADEEFFESMESHVEKAGNVSRNEFMIDAIKFYCAYIDGVNNQNYLAQSVSSVINGILDNQARRQSQLHFRLAVELAKLSHILASACELDSVQMEKLHRRCVKEVSENGSFPDARKSVEQFRMTGAAWDSEDD